MRLTHLKLILTWILAVGLLSAAEYARIRLCGWRLAEVLEIVCKEYGGFHSPQERSIRNVTSGVKRGSHEKRLRSITQRGIADECCKEKCSFLTLVSYCAYSIEKESDFHQMLDSRITSELIAHGYVDHGLF
ncbi:insulin-like isoform X2 [Stegodyphus dumicola]|uniref:insulin-like isoform X2 n=1 Tax=Stegodyphus dumicola TaxID=202533 RepID=UPI0015A9E101|nr:insulin-like isoform X2 [Stegodyphus dumicola]